MINLNVSRLLLVILIFVGLGISTAFSQKKDLGLTYLMQENNYKGVILLYNYNEDKYYTNHINKSSERVLPASTFKILNTLIFLELKIVRDTSFTLQWDGRAHKHKGRRIESWCKDTNLAEAFRNSTIWYYETLSAPIELNFYKKIMKKLKYGKVFGRKKDGDDFWNFGRKIGVSAKDQINFLVKLYKNDDYFKQENIEIVKHLMVEDITDKYTLRSKTGWTESPVKFSSKKDLGWYIGYIEYTENVYFFAVRLEKPVEQRNKGFAPDRKIIAKKALQHQFNIEVE